MKFTRRRSLVTPENYWLEVSECPLKAWRRCSEVGYSALRKDKDIGTNETDAEAYNLLYLNFSEKVGQDLEFKNYLDNLAAYVIAVDKFMHSRIEFQGAVTHNRKLLLQVKLLEAKIKKFENTGNEKVMTIAKMLNRLSKMQGFAVLEKDQTVLSYFELIKQFNEWQK